MSRLMEREDGGGAEDRADGAGGGGHGGKSMNGAGKTKAEERR